MSSLISSKDKSDLGDDLAVVRENGAVGKMKKKGPYDGLEIRLYNSRLEKASDCVVIDNGTRYLRAGFGGDGEVRIKETNLIAKDISNPTEPMTGQRIVNWDAMEKKWDEVMRKLEVCTSKKSILMTSSFLFSDLDRWKMSKYSFENFEAPSVSIRDKSIASLFGTGRTTGIVIDSGYDTTNFVPIIESQRVEHLCRFLPIGGKHVTNYLMELLEKNEKDPKNQLKLSSFESEIEKFEYFRKVKEKYCYSCYSLDQEIQKMEKNETAFTRSFQLPDGEKMTIFKERIQSVEILMSPSLINSEIDSIPDSCYRTIQSGDVDVRKDFYQNIILNGGNTMFEGLRERWSDRIQMCAPGHARIKVNSPAERNDLSFIGSSVLCTLGMDSSNSSGCHWISKDEFFEMGQSIIRRKGIGLF